MTEQQARAALVATLAARAQQRDARAGQLIIKIISSIVEGLQSWLLSLATPRTPPPLPQGMIKLPPLPPLGPLRLWEPKPMMRERKPRMNKPSIEHLSEGLQRLMNDHFHAKPGAVTHIPAQRDDDDLMLSDAIDELAALRAWKAQAESLLRALARLDLINYSESDTWVCLLCSATTPHLLDDADDNDTQARLHHITDCPVTLAKALLAESEAST